MSNDIRRQTEKLLAGLSDRTADLVEGIAAPFAEPVVRLGVTGLARAGKTVAITSLIQNLLNQGGMPLLSAAGSGRVIGAQLSEQPDLTLPRFAFENHRDALLGDPARWPESTSSISQFRLSLRYRSGTWIKRAVSGENILHIDIVDYPGEWLLDLPLMDLDFQTWSAQVFAAAEQEPRLTLAKDWLEATSQCNLHEPWDERTAQRLHQSYSEYLRQCRQTKRVKLSMLQPGRFLMPGDLAGSPALTFAPLPIKPGQAIKHGSIAAGMAKRFEDYKHLIVWRFFKEHFSRIDRQLVLVDLLGAAEGGAVAINELQDAMVSVLNAFKPGQNTWLNPLVHGKRVERILFAATKADHLPTSQHDELQRLLTSLLNQAQSRAAFAGAKTSVMALAGLRATTPATAQLDGQRVDCVSGIPVDSNSVEAVYPGKLPRDLIDLKNLAPGDVEILAFRPPLTLEEMRPFPHINLDRALEELLGDLLQ
ncbi:MAG: YcjX family protein [Alphaproteobacteria bacterium]